MAQDFTGSISSSSVPTLWLSHFLLPLQAPGPFPLAWTQLHSHLRVFPFADSSTRILFLQISVWFLSPEVTSLMRPSQTILIKTLMTFLICLCFAHYCTFRYLVLWNKKSYHSVNDLAQFNHKLHKSKEHAYLAPQRYTGTDAQCHKHGHLLLSSSLQLVTRLKGLYSQPSVLSTVMSIVCAFGLSLHIYKIRKGLWFRNELHKNLSQKYTHKHTRFISFSL